MPTLNTGGLPLPPRGLDEIRAALACVPPRVPGSGTYGRYLRLAGGLVQAVAEAGGTLEDAVAMMVDHSPEWTEAAKVVRSVATGGNAAAFWAIGGDHGFDLARRGLERRELTPEERRAAAEAKAARERLAAGKAELDRLRCSLRGGAYERLLDVAAEAAGDPDLCAGDWDHRLTESSPIPIPGEPADPWRVLLRTLFDPSDRIFTGGPRDSGQPRHAKHFRTVREILALDRPLGIDPESGAPDWRATCATFAEGNFARLKANVTGCRYRLIEFDGVEGREPRTWFERDRNKRLSLAVIRWLARTFGLDVVAIIDTGSKSLHFWTAGIDDDLAAFLAANFGEIRPGHRLIDPGVVTNPAMIFRLPGCVHTKTGQSARLLYLKHPSTNQTTNDGNQNE